MAPVAWSGTCKARFVPWLVGVTIVMVLILMRLAHAGENPAPNWVGWVIAAIGLIVIAAGLILGTVEVTIDPTGVVLRYGSIGWPVQRFPWSDLTSVTAIDVNPMEWGGWGYRWLPWKEGSAAVMRGGEGLRLDRVGGHVFVVTVNGAPDAAHAAGQFLTRH